MNALKKGGEKKIEKVNSEDQKWRFLEEITEKSSAY